MTRARLRRRGRAVTTVEGSNINYSYQPKP
jgi:hypothetical protein